MTQKTKRTKTAPSILSADLYIRGQLMTKGEAQIDGVVQGDMRATLLTVGESAQVDGEIAGDHVTIKGRVKGTIRGRCVYLCATCHVDGDIFHEALAVENGAVFNGTVCREKDPLAKAKIQTQASDKVSQNGAGKAANPQTSTPPKAEPQRATTQATTQATSPQTRQAEDELTRAADLSGPLN